MSEFGPAIQRIAIFAVPFLLAIVLHEVAHGLTALRLGDPTAKASGRLTLNPIKHIDPLGALVFVMSSLAGIGIGWAKPVPVNPRHFEDPLRGMMYVSMAGPLTNFLLAICFAALFHGLIALDGAGMITADSLVVVGPLAQMIQAGVMVNLALGFFNLIPVPPLDGSKIVTGLLPREMAFRFMRFERYGFIVIVLLLATGVLGRVIGPPIYAAAEFLLF